MTFDAGVQTANTLLLQIGDFELEFANQSGIDVSGSTAITWGDFVSGTAWYYWQEDGSQSQITGNYCLNTGTRSQVLFSSDKINCTIVGGGDSASYPAVSPSLNDIYLSCGTGNTISVTGIVPYSYTGGIGIKGFASPTYNANSTALNYNSTFANASVSGTNVRNISTYYPSSPYLPDLRGDVSYNDAVPIVLNWVNDNLDEGEPELTPDDVLKWEDIAPTEPTEPTESTEAPSGGFVFDYDEVVSPSELREELNAETYDVDELNTELSSETYPIVLPPHDGNDPQAITQVSLFIPTALQAGKEFLQYHGVYSVFISAAVISAIATIIKGR